MHAASKNPASTLLLPSNGSKTQTYLTDRSITHSWKSFDLAEVCRFSITLSGPMFTIHGTFMISIGCNVGMNVQVVCALLLQRAGANLPVSVMTVSDTAS
eukprot:1893270-Amphidinium_carterae.1